MKLTENEKEKIEKALINQINTIYACIARLKRVDSSFDLKNLRAEASAYGNIIDKIRQ